MGRGRRGRRKRDTFKLSYCVTVFHLVILDMFMKLSKDTMVALYTESAIQLIKYKNRRM